MKLFRRRRRVYTDPEVLELFADEPELVAIVDAVAATQRQPAARRGPLVVAVAAAAAVFVVAALVPWRGDDGGLVEGARAAVGDGRVVHVVSSRIDVREQLVDVATGAARPTRIEVETWFDDQNRRLRAVTRREGVTVADVVDLNVPSVGAELSPLDFGRGYRAALERAGDEDADDARGLASVRLSIRGVDYDVAIDRETHLPRRYRRLDSEVTWTVRQLGSGPARASDFQAALVPTPYANGAVTASTRTTATLAAERLRALVWAGGGVGTRQLTGVRVERLVKRGVAGSATTFGVRLNYGGSLLEGGIDVRQAASPEPAYGFAEGRRTLGFNPLPSPGTLSLVAPNGDGVWTGQLRVGRVYVTVRGPSRAAVIATARSLRAYS